MSDRSLYIKAAKQLKGNKGQWAAYESKGHCVVLAGPGSGKTKTLTIKLARLLAEDIQEPRGIACITYNNECARELETRLLDLGVEAGNRIFIGTVHSFSLTQIILPYAKTAKIDIPEGFRVAKRDEKTKALARAFGLTIVGPGSPQSWESDMNYHRRTILNREGDFWKTRNPDLSRLAEAYESELREMGLIDFDDMPLLAVRALKENPWLRRAILAKYPVLVVDEYQDLGRALHSMVMGLCFNAGIRLFAVGDADQSIYGFTGARPELLQKLSSREDVETVTLGLNYRSGSQIVMASNYALGEERGYQAVDDAEEGIIYFHPQHGNYEQQADVIFSGLLPKIQERHPEMKPGDLAILYPAAWIGNAVADFAQTCGHSIIRTDGNAIYPRSSKLMRWLEQCARWCSGGWKQGSPRLSIIVKDAKRIFSEAFLDKEELANFQFRLTAELWKQKSSNLNLGQWLTGLKESLLDELFSECRTIQDEEETLLTFIARATEGDCLDMTIGQFSGQGEGNDYINLSTLHSSKGREFKAVIMFGMDERRIPRPNPTNQQIIEARRLFYVGFTRAKTELHIMYTENQASRFVTEVKDRLQTGT